jgi:hypothetical protein
LRDTQGRVVQSVVSVINVALMESMEKEAPSQRVRHAVPSLYFCNTSTQVLALFDDDVVQSLCASFMTHASSIVRGKVTIMLVLLMRARPLALLPMFSKKLAQGLEKVGKDSDSYISAAAAAFASAVDEFIPPSLAALHKEVTQPKLHTCVCNQSVMRAQVSQRSPQGSRGLAICSLLKLLSECSRCRALFARRTVATAVCALLKNLRDASAPPFVECVSAGACCPPFRSLTCVTVLSGTGARCWPSSRAAAATLAQCTPRPTSSWTSSSPARWR